MMIFNKRDSMFCDFYNRVRQSTPSAYFEMLKNISFHVILFLLFCVCLWRTDMDLLTVKEAGKLWGITTRMVTIYCETGRIPGAFKKGNLWLIPGDAIKPVDRRRSTIDQKDRS